MKDSIQNNLIDVTDEELVSRLSREMVALTKNMQPDQVYSMVDMYYRLQGDRIRSGNQIDALVRGDVEQGLFVPPEDAKLKDKALIAYAETQYPVLSWFFNRIGLMEAQAQRALKSFSESQPIGQWALGITGIGPVIAAGLIANIDIKEAPTVGHIWRYAGLDPTIEWLGTERAKDMVREVCGAGRGEVTADHMAQIAKLTNRNMNRLLEGAKDEDGRITKASLSAYLARRPWNNQLKTLCWKLGESFVKVSGRDNDYYGHMLVARKHFEWTRNLKGEVADQANRIIANKNIGKATEAYKWYSGSFRPKPGCRWTGKIDELMPQLDAVAPGEGTPMLPPAHIHARSRRYAVKMFLSHYHDQLYRLTFNQAPPNPYPIQYLGHVDYLAVPSPITTVGGTRELPA